MTAAKEERGRWKKGESGNPRGRSPGTGKVARLRENIAQHLPEIIGQLVIKAKEGDPQAAKLLLERVIPPVKSMEQSVKISFPVDADLSTQGQSIILAVANGTLAPSQGSALLTSLGTLARIKEMDELEKRLTALEQANEHKK
ncbi:DUF5681 domain-containing protein [Nitrosomonas sp. Is35]|uniref:DUF5681 domain-containing protein n=1 Tax=Nitrosomonas sp. Is35 TaxID=3080534 RepID=UPI00294AD960|nr:DUF5681 domain-containing protein [Nitrosomonas sp. Is35]MDV6348612.1 DUF5681 domain-containing protein [Nitrosomonas sp. Is35]